MADDNPRWRCRQCLTNEKTADFKSEAHMKSHLANHGYGTWRCTGCTFIGLRKTTIQAHHRASGETSVTAYFDPVLNHRANLEVKACRLPHSNPWTGLSPITLPDANALAAARATISHQVQAQITTATSRPVDYLNTTDEEAQALDREVAWSSGSLTPLERSSSPAPPVTPTTPLDLHTIRRQAGAIASQHIDHLSNTEDPQTYIVRAKAINYLFEELYHLRRAFDFDDPASLIHKAIGTIIDILLWHRTLLVSKEDLEMVKKNLRAIRHLTKATKLHL